MRKTVLLILVAALVVGLAACNFISTAKKQLYAWKEGWLSVQTDVAKWTLAGKIPLEDVAKFRAIDEKFRAAHHAATVGLQTYESVDSVEGKEKLIALLAKVPEIALEAYRLYEALKLPIPSALADIAKG